MYYILIAGVLYIVSIIIFFIINGTSMRTFREMMKLHNSNDKIPGLTWFGGKDVLLLSCIIILLSNLLPLWALFLIGLLMVFMQRILIWGILRVIWKFRSS